MADSANDQVGRHDLRRRLAVLVVVLLSFLLVDAAAAIGLAGQRGHERSQLRDRLLPAVVVAEGLQTAYVEQATGLRGFVATGDEELLGSYEAARRSAERSELELQRLLSGRPAALSRLAEVRARAAGWRTVTGDPAISARTAGDSTRAMAVVGSDASEEAFDDLGKANAALQDQVTDELWDATARLDRAADATNTVVVSSALLALVAAAALLGQLQQWVLRPVRDLARAVRGAAADPDAGPVVVPGASGELQDVAEHAEQLRRVAVGQGNAARRARAAVAQEAPTVQAVADELAPSATSLPAGISCAGTTLAHDGLIAGDLHDRVVLGDGRIAVLVADAAGHGPESALVALRLKTAVLGSLRAGRTPAQALHRASIELGDTGESFLTVFVATVVPSTGDLVHASAGHPAAMLLPLSQEQPTDLHATGPLLGPLPGRWHDRRSLLPPGGSLVVVTDGVADAVDRTGGRYGDERLRDALARYGLDGPDPGALVRRVLDDVEAFSGGRSGDDRTVFVLSRAVAVPAPAAAAHVAPAVAAHGA